MDGCFSQGPTLLAKPPRPLEACRPHPSSDITANHTRLALGNRPGRPLMSRTWEMWAHHPGKGGSQELPSPAHPTQTQRGSVASSSSIWGCVGRGGPEEERGREVRETPREIKSGRPQAQPSMLLPPWPPYALGNTPPTPPPTVSAAPHRTTGAPHPVGLEK